jgi:butyryl-CoA dehydrogenase
VGFAEHYRRHAEFVLHDWLQVERLAARPRFAEHSRETFSAVLDLAQRLAREKFAPFNRLADTEEPTFDGERVHLPAPTVEAMRAYAASGLLAAMEDEAHGGLQLPCSVAMAANAFISHASVGMGGYAMLTRGNAGLLMAHGTPVQQRVFAANEFVGRWFGTMCLSEPQAGSSLSDIATRAEPDGEGAEQDPLGPRFRLRGNKMWISAGEHEITENIVHLVLAKIPGADGWLVPGVRGISLFICPKWLVDGQGTLTGERNDVALAGLNHKLGYRGTTNTLLNFGEGRFRPGGRAGAVAYLVGRPGEGLKAMFHMMNEARIGVGLGATMLGYAGYEASLDYARQRPQGRPASRVGAGPSQADTLPHGGATPQASGGPQIGKDPTQPQVPIVQHADVRRMLLAQKAYVEGAVALELYCARLVDEQDTADDAAKAEAGLLLDVLIPIAKSWPSEWCLEANSLAIQVMGGYGYTRDFPVEQHWRDNRLNMIHEGTHGIQALDLLGRKVVMNGGEGLSVLAHRVSQTLARAGQCAPLADDGNRLAAALQRLGAATQSAWSTGVPEEALGNAVPYLQGFGHTVLAWVWLELALTAQAALDGGASGDDADFLRGKLAAKDYFFRHELPKCEPWLRVVAARDATTREVRDEWL